MNDTIYIAEKYIKGEWITKFAGDEYSIFLNWIAKDWSISLLKPSEYEKTIRFKIVEKNTNVKTVKISDISFFNRMIREGTYE